MHPGKRKALADDAHGRVLERLEKLKESVRARVEHAFHVVRNLFKMRKVRYRGLAKNTAQLYTLFGMANLVLVKRRLFELDTLNPSWSREKRRKRRETEQNCAFGGSGGLSEAETLSKARIHGARQPLQHSKT